jgi:hypothetical protein
MAGCDLLLSRALAEDANIVVSGHWQAMRWGEIQH